MPTIKIKMTKPEKQHTAWMEQVLHSDTLRLPIVEYKKIEQALKTKSDHMVGEFMFSKDDGTYFKKTPTPAIIVRHALTVFAPKVVEMGIECIECNDLLAPTGHRTYLLPCGFLCKHCMEDVHNKCTMCFGRPVLQLPSN